MVVLQDKILYYSGATMMAHTDSKQRVCTTENAAGKIAQAARLIAPSCFFIAQASLTLEGS